MLKIREDKDSSKYILLIPSMLDAHFTLLKYAFFSKNYKPVIVELEDGVVDTGLKYVNNDMCFPSIVNVGQIISALQSGEYDCSRTRILMPTAGDACRGSNYVGVLRRAVAKAKFDVPVVCLNLKGLEKDNKFVIEPLMAWRALFGLYYGDILMLLLNQTRPNELHKGDSQKVWDKWVKILSDEIKNTKHLTIVHMKRNFYRIVEDFSKIELIDNRKQRIGIVGELFIKYCHLGNWDLIKYLEENDCESHTNGLSWYAMYYMDSHLLDSNRLESFAYRIGLKLFGNIQNTMIKAIKKYGLYTMENFETVKREAEPFVSHNFCVGDGWLIGSEIVGHVFHGCKKVIAAQPFGCMPNQTCGHGLYPSLQRKIPELRFVCVDVDSSASKMNYYNRVQMLINSNR